jgi:acyl-CoA thioesterase II
VTPAPSLNCLSAEQILALEEVGPDRFRSLHNQDNYAGAVFGGQYLGQALAAAGRTVPEWPAHSCSSQFLLKGRLETPLEFVVERTRDGRRFAFRRVLGLQDGRPIFDMLCSFHAPEEGVEHQGDRGSTPPDPESLPDLKALAGLHGERLSERMAAIYRSDFPVELRLIESEEAMFGTGPQFSRSFWFRMPSAAAIGDPRDQQCLLAFMSDYWFASVAGAVHSSPGSAGASLFMTLNHSLWIHGPVRADEWLLCRTESPWGGSGRGLARGLIYDRAGELVASAAQEVAMQFR